MFINDGSGINIAGIEEMIPTDQRLSVGAISEEQGLSYGTE